VITLISHRESGTEIKPRSLDTSVINRWFEHLENLAEKMMILQSRATKKEEKSKEACSSL
jgi:hypothetical protein